MKHVALLRGINVGGNNIIKKEALKHCFEQAGCESVGTYIQSGNIVFRSNVRSQAKIVKDVQSELRKALKNEIEMALFLESDYNRCLAKAHASWGNDSNQKHNALFHLDNISIGEAKIQFPEIQKQFEKVTFTERAIFWSGSKENYTKTSYTKDLAKSALYKRVTIRNSKTCFRLQELLEAL